jgi:hypothetical protein
MKTDTTKPPTDAAEGTLFPTLLHGGFARRVLTSGGFEHAIRVNIARPIWFIRLRDLWQLQLHSHDGYRGVISKCRQ